MDYVTYPIELSEQLNWLPAYDLTQDLSDMLELSRQVTESNRYYWSGYAFPNTESTILTSLQNVEGQISIPSGSIVTAISAYSQRGEGFKFNLFDKGAKQSIFNRTFGRKSAFGEFSGGVTVNVPSGPSWLLSPLVILRGGMVNWQITNMASANNEVQVLLNVAVPIDQVTTGTVRQKGGKNG